MNVLISLFALVLVILFFANIFSILFHLLRYIFGEFATSFVHFKPIKPSYKKALEQHFTYYKNLNENHKRSFEQRVQRFIDLKTFVPRNFTEIPDEIKAIVAASAIQLTFGLPRVYLQHFSKILIYPDDYYSVIFRRYHQGEVNLHGGIIVLSWRNFARGYMDDADGRNLGLHEMAHALRLENEINNGEYGFLNKSLLRKWRKEAEKTIEYLKNGGNGFFRDYAATNRDEFFAVAAENFFERPNEFNDKFPELYQLLTQLLRQDPILIKNSNKKL